MNTDLSCARSFFGLLSAMSNGPFLTGPSSIGDYYEPHHKAVQTTHFTTPSYTGFSNVKTSGAKHLQAN